MEQIHKAVDQVSSPRDLYDLIQNRDNNFYLKAPSDMLLKDGELQISASGLSMDLEELLWALEDVRVSRLRADEQYHENWMVW